MRSAEPTLDHLRAWAYEPDAPDAMETHGPLADQDGDLSLQNWRYVPSLIEFAADPQCPNGDSCAWILTDYATHLMRYRHEGEFARLREAAAQARGRHRVDVWATHVERMLSYAERPGKVSRATAEQMAVDLLIGPASYARWDDESRARGLTVRIAAPTTHWVATWHSHHPEHLYINRRTGAYEWTRADLTPEQVRQI